MTRSLRAFALVCAAAISLAGCNAESLRSACALKDTVFADWTAYADVAGVSTKTRGSVTSAYQAATTVCANPPSDAATAIVTVSSVGLQIAIARKAAEREAKAKGAPLPVSLRRLAAAAPG